MNNSPAIFALDLTKRPPRSPRCLLGGYASLPRMLDKGRATVAGMQGEYHYNCPLDQRLVDFVGFDPAALLEQLAAGRRVRRQDSWLRQCMSRLGNGVRRAILQDGISDSGCGIKAFHRRVMDAFIPIRTLYSFMPALAISAGFKVSEIPAQHRPRLAGKSKYGLRVFLWRPLLDLFGVWWFQHRRCAIPEFVAEKASSEVPEHRPKGEDG